MKNYLLFKQIARAFFLTCTCITIGLATFLTIFSVETIPSAALWQIPFISLIIALTGGLIYHSKWELNKQAYLIRNVFHFILIGALLFFAADFFNWFKYAPLFTVVIFIVMTVLTYIIVSVSIYYVKKRQAQCMNEKLIEFKQKSDNDEK